MPTIIIDQSLSDAVSLALSLAAFAFTIVKWRIDEYRRKREALRNQAGKIACWIEGYDAIVINNSDLPIYGAVIVIEKGPWFYAGQHGPITPDHYPGAEAECQLIPPGTWKIAIPNMEGFPGASAYPAAKMGFVSANNGTSWVLDGSGRLAEIDEEPITFFGLSAPYASTYPRQLS